MKPVVFHPEAQAEFFAAQDYYERCVDGLGLDFRGEVEAAAEVIQASPQRWSLRADGARSYLVHRFPFAIIFLDFAVKNLDCRRDPPSPPAWLLENSAVANRTTDRDCCWHPNHACVVEGLSCVELTLSLKAREIKTGMYFRTLCSTKDVSTPA